MTENAFQRAARRWLNRNWARLVDSETQAADIVNRLLYEFGLNEKQAREVIWQEVINGQSIVR